MSVNPTIYLKRWIQIPLRRLIKKLAHSDLVQSLVWGRNETQSLVALDIFTDSKGNAFQRLKGWRGSIVPRYARALEPQPDPPQVKTKEIIGARNTVIAMENFFQINGYSIKNMKILEIGCHTGTHVCAGVEAAECFVLGRRIEV